MTVNLKTISLFTGIGGIDFGFEAAGYETRVALDFDAVACATIRLNRNWPIIKGPINEILSETILSTAGLKSGEADVLIGGPPCQPFSKSGYWATGDSRRLTDPRAGTLAAYLRVLRDTQPKAFLLENVPGLAYQGKSEGIDALQAGIEEINRDRKTSYAFEYRVLNAVDYGVPQLRERIFIIGSRDGRKFQFPDRTHFPPESPEVLSGKDRHRTAWDAFADLSPIKDEMTLKIRGKWAELLPSIPEGHNYLWHTDRGGGIPLFGWRRRYWNFLLKLAKDKPSWTVQAQPGPATGPFHWENRRLSTEELCRLQTFPKGIRFECSPADIQKLTGNAVPSALAETLAREIAAQFFGVREARRSATLIPTAQEKVPSPARRLPVAKKYLHLLGSDSAHPGTGLGRGALYRGEEAA